MRGFFLGCRVYMESQQITGWPSVELIREALEAAQGKHHEMSRCRSSRAPAVEE
jgi:hypothetical protein